MIYKLLFNKNGIHFLKYAKPYKYNLLSDLNQFNEFLNNNKFSADNIVLDGSIVLSQYGLRKNADIDYFAVNKINDDRYEDRDYQLKYHKQSKNNLIYNPEFFFKFNDFKFISFDQIYLMKKNRDEEKDKIDCSLMQSLIENKKLNSLFSKIKQKIFYSKIKSKKLIRKFKLYVLKKTGLHEPLRYIYRKIKNN